MSMLPFTHPLRTGDWWDSSNLGRLFDQNFGVGMFNDDPFFNQPIMPSMTPYWMRARTRPSVAGAERGSSEVCDDAEKFAVNLDVSHFTPEEIKVKMVDNNLVITAKHEERMDPHGFVMRSFSRRYVLPKDVDGAKLTSSLSPSGILRIEAPKEVVEKSNERQIPIQFGQGMSSKSVEQGSGK